MMNGFWCSGVPAAIAWYCDRTSVARLANANVDLSATISHMVSPRQRKYVLLELFYSQVADIYYLYVERSNPLLAATLQLQALHSQGALPGVGLQQQHAHLQADTAVAARHLYNWYFDCLQVVAGAMPEVLLVDAIADDILLGLWFSEVDMDDPDDREAFFEDCIRDTVLPTVDHLTRNI